ncbi:hypothetical protein Ancab_008850 [Ancistrocladus abbreviatus]
MALYSQIAQKIHVLLVDDDSTCHAMVGGLLRKLKYNVLTVSSAAAALCVLQNCECFDIVLVDVHMPGMSGLELLKHVTMEFSLPVILMSADGDEETMLKGLEGGAVQYFVKPIKLPDLIRLWQFVFSWRKSKTVSTEAANALNNNVHNVSWFACFNSEEENGNRRKRKVSGQTSCVEIADAEGDNTSTRTKFCWTPQLHNLFMEAIHIVGFDRATPLKILKYMKVPGLTREQIASHLQKFRIYLRRAAQQRKATGLALLPGRKGMHFGLSNMSDHNPSQQAELPLPEEQQRQLLYPPGARNDSDHMGLTQREAGISPYLGHGVPASVRIHGANQTLAVIGQESASTQPKHIQGNQAQGPSSEEWVDDVFKGTSFTELLTGAFPYEDLVMVKLPNQV